MDIIGNKEKFIRMYTEFYEKSMRDVLESFNVIVCALIKKYFQLQPQMLDYTTARFLNDEACVVLKKEDSYCVDVTDVTLRECLPCVAFCIDMLRHYDEYREKQKNS
jgi:hypothetical protein